MSMVEHNFLVNSGNSFKKCEKFWAFYANLAFWGVHALEGTPIPGLKLTPAPPWLKLILIDLSTVKHNFLVNSGNSF